MTTPSSAEQGKYILNSLGIVPDHGYCSFPTEMAAMRYDRAIYEVEKWIGRFCTLAIEQERERCAKVAEAYRQDDDIYMWGVCAKEIAAAIRKGD